MLDFSSLLPLCLLLSVGVCWAVSTNRLPSPKSAPDNRSLHHRPTARGGGLGVAVGLLFSCVAIGLPTPVWLSLTALWCISAWDDWHGTSAQLRLSVQAIATSVIALVWLPNDSAILLVLTVISLIWCLNLFNFMDGADGVAGLTALMGGLGLATLAAIAPPDAFFPNFRDILVPLSLSVSAATLGFLMFNWPPARIFMGDGGSTLLGLVLAVISLKGVEQQLWPLAAPVALFVPFWADATFTLIRRTLTGHSPLRAHRDHFYQRLVLSGLGHSGLLTWMFGWNLLAMIVALALALATNINETLRLLAAVAFGAVYLLAANRATKLPPSNLLLNPRTALALVYDLIAVAAAWCALFWARFNFNFDAADYSARDLIRSLAFALPVHAVVLVSLGLYRGMWRFASVSDLWLIVKAAFVAAAATALLFTVVRPDSFIWPRSVLILQPFMLILLMGGARVAYRSWKEHRLYGISAVRGEPVIVLGAGAAGARLVDELRKSESWRAVALLDDDSTKLGARLHGTPILGALDQVQTVAQRFGAKHAIIAMPHSPHTSRRRAAALTAAAGLTTLTVPAYDEMLADSNPLGRIRAIELEDLLGRDPVSLDTEGLSNWLAGKTVLVTGAGGSIGFELCAQLARFHPGRLVMLDLSEFAAHGVNEHVISKLGVEACEVYVADVRDPHRMLEIFKHERPAIVFHAAAYKHVPLTESVNAWEAVRNNVLGTIITAQCAQSVGAEKFVLVSTDKAVRASSIMGASKRLAELALMSFAASPTQFVGVRFGNVLGSNGSVIPKFKKQIDAGGPVTVTHPEMTRFFMSIPEAAQLVIQAALIGEARSLYVLDMGEPVRIVDLAHELIRLAKGSASAIPISYTGLRPGEKLFEELLGDAETFVPTKHDKVRRVIQTETNDIDLEALTAWLNGERPAPIRTALKRWVVDFNPPGGEQDLRKPGSLT